MALTRFRLPASGSAAVSPAIQSYTHTQTTRRPLPASDATALATQAYTPDAADDLDPGDAHHVQFVSAGQTSGDSIASGATVKFCVQGLEAHTGNNLFIQIWVGVYTNDGSILQETLLAKTLDNLELSTGISSRTFSAITSAGYTFTSNNERIVVEFSVSGDPQTGGGVQGHNASLRWGSNGAGGDLLENYTQSGTTLNPWFEIDITSSSPQTLTPGAPVTTITAPALGIATLVSLLAGAPVATVSAPTATLIEAPPEQTLNAGAPLLTWSAPAPTLPATVTLSLG